MFLKRSKSPRQIGGNLGVSRDWTRDSRINHCLHLINGRRGGTGPKEKPTLHWAITSWRTVKYMTYGLLAGETARSTV